ncbi:MAG: hypothetical protein JWO20_1614 [Candidatus Angelobacter sp.]|jgi:hypothetical protein|nr:hypothetical protein [Candidatus Angelobacter sp.]
MTFKVGDWVESSFHGIGQIDEDRAHGKFAVRFAKYPTEIKLIIAASLSPSEPPSPDFSFPKITKARTPGANTFPRNRKLAISFDHLVSGFLRVFPDGFDGARFDVAERQYKDKAALLLREQLSREMFERKLSGETDSLYDSVKKVVQATNLIFSREKIKLVSALKDEINQKLFAQALFELLYGSGDEEERFESFVGVASRLDSCKWTVATYFQFLATAGEKMFMKPAVMQPMADSVSVALEYAVTPNWRTYCKLQELSEKVMAELKNRGLTPRSGMDVQGFIWSAIRINQDKYET